MSGHNKWSKIKHKKAVTDAEKSKIFSKYARLITLESKKAVGDVNSAQLKAVIEKAKRENMPAENINRAIKKGVGGNSGSLEQVTYESYGPGGTALVIEGVTDNRNRTAAEIKHLLSKHGLQLAQPGSAMWAFEKAGTELQPKTTMPIQDEDADKLEKLISELEKHDDVQIVYTNVK